MYEKYFCRNYKVLKLLYLNPMLFYLIEGDRNIYFRAAHHIDSAVEVFLVFRQLNLFCFTYICYYKLDCSAARIIYYHESTENVETSEKQIHKFSYQEVNSTNN